MKFDYFKAILILCCGGLVAWGMSALCLRENLELLMAIVVMVVFLLAAIAYSIDVPGTRGVTTNLRVLTTIVLLLLLAMDLIFSFYDFSPRLFIVLNGVIIIIAALIAKGIFGKKGEL